MDTSRKRSRRLFRDILAGAPIVVLPRDTEILADLETMECRRQGEVAEPYKLGLPRHNRVPRARSWTANGLLEPLPPEPLVDNPVVRRLLIVVGSLIGSGVLLTLYALLVVK